MPHAGIRVAQPPARLRLREQQSLLAAKCLSKHNSVSAQECPSQLSRSRPRPPCNPRCQQTLTPTPPPHPGAAQSANWQPWQRPASSPTTRSLTAAAARACPAAHVAIGADAARPTRQRDSRDMHWQQPELQGAIGPSDAARRRGVAATRWPGPTSSAAARRHATPPPARHQRSLSLVVARLARSRKGLPTHQMESALPNRDDATQKGNACTTKLGYVPIPWEAQRAIRTSRGI
eukprot:1510317-Prymnesium_polylepis.1